MALLGVKSERKQCGMPELSCLPMVPVRGGDGGHHTMLSEGMGGYTAQRLVHRVLFLLHAFKDFFFLLTYWVGTGQEHMCHNMLVKVKGQLVDVGSFYHVGLRITLRPSGLVASIFIC